MRILVCDGVVFLSLTDYLDCKDPTLAFAVYHASQANSFPVDVLQVSNSSFREEFLLCFNGKSRVGWNPSYLYILTSLKLGLIFW